MGDLVKIWIPKRDYDEFSQLKKDFGSFFGRDWDEVMAGAEEPFSCHRDWSAYLAVAGLREHQVVLADLTRRLREEGWRIYNTILG